MCHSVRMSTAHEEHEQGWIATDRDSFGARLVLIRQRMGWSNVKRAALACGIPAETWRSWEQGSMPQNLVEACTVISARTGCGLDWLIGTSGDGRRARRYSKPQPSDPKVVPLTRMGIYLTAA